MGMPLGAILATDRSNSTSQRPAHDHANVITSPRHHHQSAAYTPLDQVEDEPELAMCVNAISLGVMAQMRFRTFTAFYYMR